MDQLDYFVVSRVGHMKQQHEVGDVRDEDELRGDINSGHKLSKQSQLREFPRQDHILHRYIPWVHLERW